MKNLSNNKGVTLVALIITVVIMLILSGVSVGMAINNGNLFDKTSATVEKYNAKVDEQNKELEKLSGVLEEYIPTPTDVSYFDITSEGVVSLKKTNVEGDGLTKIVIPKTIDGIEVKTVKACGDEMFATSESSFTCSGLRKVDMSLTNISEIGNWAFKGCGNLEELVLPNSLKTIGNGAFADCTNIERLHIPVGTERLYLLAFQNWVKEQTIEIAQKLIDENDVTSGEFYEANVIKY